MGLKQIALIIALNFEVCGTKFSWIDELQEIHETHTHNYPQNFLA